MAFDLPTEPVPVTNFEPAMLQMLQKAGYREVNGVLVPPPAVLSAAEAQAQAYMDNNVGPTPSTSGMAPTNPAAGTLQGMLDNLGQVVQDGVNSLAGYGSGGGASSPYGPSAEEAYGAEMQAQREFDARKGEGTPINTPANRAETDAMLEDLQNRNPPTSAAGPPMAYPPGPAGSLEYNLRMQEIAAGGAGPHPSSTDPAERGAASSPSSGAENPGRINVNGVMMTPEEYSAYMGGAGSSPDRAAEAERAAANGGQPTAGFNPSSDPFGVNAPATPPDVPNGGPGSPGYNSAPRPEDDLAGWRDYDNNGIDDRKQNFVGSGVFNNPGAIMPGAAGTSPVGGWGNAINTGVGGPVELGGGGGGGPSLGGYGDLGGYPSGGGTAGSGGNFTAPGAGGGGFTIPPAPSFTFPDVSTIGGGTGTSGGTGTGTGTGGFTFPTFENPLGGGGTTGGGTAGSGATGGSGVATTTSSGGTGTNPLVGQLAGSYQNAIDSANMANENRFATGLELLLKRAEQAGSSIQNLNYEGMNDIGRNFTQQRARADQDLINRGLGNTTVREGIFRGYTSDESAARNRFADDQVRKNIDENFRQQQGMVDWLGARNDVGPDVGQLANLASGVGAAGPAAGTTTPTTGATTPTATTPTAGTQPATQPAAPRVTTPANPNGAFTKSSSPNPTISQPAASPQTATSLAGYGQSSAAPAASPASPQTPSAESMFGNLAQQWQGVVDRSARSRSVQSAPVDNTFYPIGPQGGGTVAANNQASEQQAASEAAANRAANPNLQSAMADNVSRGLREFQGMSPGMPGYDQAFSSAMERNGFSSQPSSPPPSRQLVGANPLTTPQTGGGLPGISGGAMIRNGVPDLNTNDNPLSMGGGSPSTPQARPLVGAPPLTMPGMGPQPAPAGPSLMGYPDAPQQSQQMMSQARDMAMLSAPPPSSGPRTPWGVGQTFESGYKPTMVATPPQGMYTPGAAAPAPIGAPPVSATTSGMPAPPPPSSYQPPSLPFGTSQVQANQVSIGPDGIPTFTAPNGQRKPVAYYQSLGQYGVTA
jgi:hypothetical protein